MRLAKIIYKENSKFLGGAEGYEIWTTPDMDTEDLSFCCAYPLVDNMVHFQFITKIKELCNLDYTIY